MELKVVSAGEVAKTDAITMSELVFAQDYKPGTIHQVVTAYLAAKRSGSKANKSRSEVRGGGRKPWRQKGTGRARAGTINSPIWRGGGVTFAAKPRSYEQKVNRKMYVVAMRSILSELLRQQRLTVVDRIALAEPKTKLMLAWLKQQGISNNVLIVTDLPEPNLELASRNLPWVHVCVVGGVDPVSLVGAHHIVISQEAIKQLEQRLS